MDATALKDFLQTGGTIKRYRSRADEIAAMVTPGKFWCWHGKYKKMWQARHKNNQYSHQISKTPSVKSRRPATAPGGGIEPGLPNNSRSNPKKIVIRRPAAISGGEIRWERG